MYKLLLISKYLRRKLAPLFAAVAVTICTAMVIIVASVMGGFLGLMQTTAKQLTPDVMIQSPSLTGFEGYEELTRRLQAEPEVALATPAIASPASATFSDLVIPMTRDVLIQGIDPDAYDQIVPYRNTLLWSAADIAPRFTAGRSQAEALQLANEKYDIRTGGETLELPIGMRRPGTEQDAAPGAVIGVAVSPAQQRGKDGSYSANNAYIDGRVTFAMPVFSPNGQPLDVSQPQIRVVNEFKSGFFDADSKIVFVPFDWLQKQLKMQRVEEFTEYDLETGLGGKSVVQQARCTHIYIKAAEGVTDAQLLAKARAITMEFQRERPGLILDVLTWEAVHGQLLGAVKNEKGLVTFLFAIISLVAIVMVATTFYMIVLEKTRDIGVLRAIGAPSTGVLSLFLAYGLAIGLIGAISGVWLAWFTVTNLNHLQEALATRLGTLIGSVVVAAGLAVAVAAVVSYVMRKREFTFFAASLLFIGIFVALMAATFYAFPRIHLPIFTALDSQIGWRMWDPQLYFFEKIPDEVDWNEVTYIGIGAVVSSVLGAVIPAVIAAKLNPIEALRYE